MGPPPNNCIHRFTHSLLDPSLTSALFEKGVTVCLSAPEGTSRVELARTLLKQAGFAHTSALHALRNLPRDRWLCIETPAHVEPAGEQPDPLWCAAVLGRCGPAFYAEDRPVIWTENRLSRRITLYRPGGFYED